ncbi:hypothetical protein [Nonomuraea phyllanthi]|nr:hypothetical protein [Nonomuraea phyllanthi]
MPSGAVRPVSATACQIGTAVRGARTTQRDRAITTAATHARSS